MLSKLKQALFGTDDGGNSPTGGIDDVHLATAALLMEAAMLDGTIDDAELDTVTELLTARFGLGDAQVERLVEAGRTKAENAVELYTLTKEIKDSFDADERIEMVEMLWEVAYADGVLHDYEANLIRRVCGLIYVSDPDSGKAKRRAMDRLGLA